MLGFEGMLALPGGLRACHSGHAHAAGVAFLLRLEYTRLFEICDASLSKPKG